MHDGRTRKVDTLPSSKPAPFLESHRVTLTILRGPAAGTEFELDRPRLVIGRGEAVDLRVDAVSVSSEHAALEADSNGFGIRDLASTNGVQVNGGDVISTDLKHGDRILLGECELQYVVEERDRVPVAWAVDEAD
jgi:pSer/pThr/pTyr-binding forkhead associated (FHA) protein